MSRAPQGAVVERSYLPDEEAQIRALRLLADRTTARNKAAGTSGGESDPRGDLHARINRKIIPQSE